MGPTKAHDRRGPSPARPTVRAAAPVLVPSSRPLSEVMQRAAHDPGSLAPPEIARLQRTIGNAALGQLVAGTARPTSIGLPHRLRAGVEHLSGFAMGNVRVHYNSPQPAQLQALAYTQAPDIHIAPGQERHLPHEAWHVVQQKQGRVKPTLQMKGVAINDDAGLEQEADVMGARASEAVPTAHNPSGALFGRDACSH
jgi:hypothetical protein